MKRITSIALMLLLCAQMAVGQESNCVITGTILSEQTGQPLPGIVVTVHKVYKARKLLRSVPQKFRTDSSGVFSFQVVRGAVAVIETQVEGFNVPGGVAVQIPDAGSATLETLNRVTMPEQVPVAVPTESGAPLDATFITRTPNGVLTNEQALSSLSTGLVKVTTGTGLLSIAAAADLPSGIAAPKISGGNVSNAEFDALDGATGPIQTQINGKAALSHSHAGPDITTGLIDPARLGSGTRDGTRFLRDDGTYQSVSATPGGASGDIQVNISGAFVGSLLKQGGNVIELRNGAAEQIFKIYRGYTDASNNELLKLGWDGTDAKIYAEKSGAGSVRDLSIGTAGTQLILMSGGFAQWKISETLFPAANNTLDLGTSGAQVRTGYFGTSIRTPRIDDTNGNELIKFTTTSSATNEFTVGNAAASGSPTLSVTGSDTNIDMLLSPKGDGAIKTTKFKMLNEGLGLEFFNSSGSSLNGRIGRDGATGGLMVTSDAGALSLTTGGSADGIKIITSNANKNIELTPTGKVIQTAGPFQFASVVFSSLPASPADGMTIYCSDCTKATPCASGGSGALAKRINNAWDCN